MKNSDLCDKLLARWRELCVRLAIVDHENRNVLALLELYGSSDRSYHDLHHIELLLNELDGARRHALRPDLVEVAIWYHDAVYNTKAHDNEACSAVLAVEHCGAMGLSKADAETVRELVMNTTHREMPQSVDAKILVDCDLSPLGAESVRYREFAAMVRREYAWVSEPDYRAGRSRVLQAFLHRPRIYSTQYFYGKYEKTARNNLLAELEFLKL